MQPYLAHRERPLRVCSVHYDARMVDATLEQIECEMDKVHPFEMIRLASIADEKFHPCDLLVLIGHQTPEEHLLTWVKNLAVRLADHIWVPTLIIGDLQARATGQLVEFAIESNWYFDVLDRHHLSSLAIRMANLIRIHDHLQELHRYASQLEQLERKTQAQQQRVEMLMQQRQNGPSKDVATSQIEPAQ